MQILLNIEDLDEYDGRLTRALLLYAEGHHAKPELFADICPFGKEKYSYLYIGLQ
jgi:hypothetical protein